MNIDSARNNAAHIFAIAPMMGWTNRHCRFFHRLLTKKAQLYTEMITTGALLHNKAACYLYFDQAEHPVTLQLGGNDPFALARCVRMAANAGYGAINLNLGCPSDRVKAGCFGARLMAEPQRVADCLVAMRAAAPVPISVKCRLGIDNQEPTETLPEFLSILREAGCRVFIIHARKAWLQGLNPAQNRSVPPLDYALVYRMKQEFPDLTIILNGGIHDLETAQQPLAYLDGVMMGRAAYRSPGMLAAVDRLFYGTTTPEPNTDQVMEQFFPYIAQQLSCGVKLATLIKPILGLYQGQPGARIFRRILSEQAHHSDAGLGVLRLAMASVTAYAA